MTSSLAQTTTKEAARLTPTTDARKLFLLRTAILASVVATLGFAAATVLPSYAPSPRPEIVLDRKLLDGSVPSLTLRERQEARLLVINDKYFRALIQHVPYQTVSEVPWTSSRGNSIGAAVTVTLRRNSNLSGTWPTLSYDCNEVEPALYTISSYTAKEENVSSLIVLVDLERKQIASIDPNIAAINRSKPTLRSKNHHNVCLH